jgi:hypothetical protein
MSLHLANHRYYQLSTPSISKVMHPKFASILIGWLQRGMNAYKGIIIEAVN